MLYTPGGTDKELGGNEDISGPMIGAFSGAPYGTATTALLPGAQLFVYSDGIHEIMQEDGTCWALEAFLANVSEEVRKGDGSVERLIARSRLIGKRTDFEDDVSLLEVTFE